MDIPHLVDLAPSSKDPPLIRMTLNNVSLSVTQPLFSNGDLTDFLFDMGGVRIYAQDIVPTTLPAGRNATSGGSPPFQSSERDGHGDRDDEGRTHEYSHLFS